MTLVKSIFNFLRFNKKNWKAVALCIVAATVFWFFNALNKNYATNVNFPITFDYDQDHYIAVKDLPATVRMNVSGSGWDLFRRSLGFKVPPLVMPLEKPADVKKIVGSTLPAVFAGQLERLKINFVITDTLRIQIQERQRKQFKVAIDSVAGNIHPEFGLVTRPQLVPDTVWLEGPKEIISQLPETLLLTLPETNIRGDFNEDLELSLDHKNLIRVAPEKFTVSFSVDKLEQVSRQAKLSIINIPSRLRQGGIVKSIGCTYRIPASAAKKFSGDSLMAVIDLKNKPKGSHRLVPQIIGLPQNAMLVKADTVLINF